MQTRPPANSFVRARLASHFFPSHHHFLPSPASTPSSMAPANQNAAHTPAPLVWRPTKIMNMRDLSNDDDFISHLLVEKLGTGAVPLYVHKMDPIRRLPKTDSQELLQIVRRLVLSKGTVQNSVRQAVDDLLRLPALRYYLKSYTQKQINAFATHASRYFELYHPSGSIEIAHTSRYSHKTGKSELCILATRYMAPGTVITELKGSMANLTDEEDRDLKRASMRNGDIRRDFSVIHSKSMKKNHLFLGPARFVNHDCNFNCELFREGRYITFRVLRPINIGEEITAHYGDGYFGRKNRHCLCETCEKKGRGGYAPDQDDEIAEPSDSSSNSDSDSDSEAPAPEAEVKVPLNVNERRTRRGVYAVVTREEDTDESESEEDNTIPLANAEDIPADGEIELTTEVDSASELTSLTPSVPPDPPARHELSTPEPLGRASSSLSSLSSAGEASSRSNSGTPFRSINSTRNQMAQEVVAGQDQPKSLRKSLTPATPSKRLTRSASALLIVEKDKGKGKASKSATPAETPKNSRLSVARSDIVQVKKEDSEARVLRARPAPSIAPEARKATSNPDVQRGADGKILPTCATCSNILPLISVDSKVVWGLGFENGKKKKKHDCPRCMRHFAIYNQPWPRRVPAHGTAFSVTPREESTPSDSNKRVNPKTLPVLDRKLADAVSAGKRSRREDSREEEPVSKRRKMDTTSSAVLKPKQTSSSVTRMNKSTPSAPTASDKMSPALSKSSTESPSELKRKRGRPRLSDKLLNSAPIVKAEETATHIPPKSSFSQPRNTNGRFGRKDTLLKAQQRAARAAAGLDGSSPPRKERPQPHPTRSSPRKKRAIEDLTNDDEESLRHQSPFNEDRDEEELLPLQRVLPRRGLNFKGASLVSNPNPLRFALQAWANPVLRGETSSSEDDQGPETPEDHYSPPPLSILDFEQDEHDFPMSAPPLPRAPLTHKPSPLTFAKRRWASTSLSPLEDDSKASEPRRPFVMEQAGQNFANEINSESMSTPTSPISDNLSYPSNTSSEDEAAMELVHVYPVVSKSHHVVPKSMQFCSHAFTSTTTPTFIHAGWDDTYSDASDV